MYTGYYTMLRETHTKSNQSQSQFIHIHELHIIFLHKSQSYNQDCKMIEVGIVIYYPIKSMEY